MKTITISQIEEKIERHERAIRLLEKAKEQAIDASNLKWSMKKENGNFPQNDVINARKLRMIQKAINWRVQLSDVVTFRNSHTRSEYRSDLRCPCCGSDNILTLPYMDQGKCLECKEKLEVHVFEREFIKRSSGNTNVDDYVQERLSNSF